MEKKVKLTVYLPVSVKDKLVEKSTVERRTISSTVEMLVDMYMNPVNVEGVALSSHSDTQSGLWFEVPSNHSFIYYVCTN